MKPFLLTVLALVLSFGPASAQTAQFNSYGSPCPATTSTLNVVGVPRLGTSFTVRFVMFPGLCTRKFCGCACCDCNDCRGSLLVMGAAKSNFNFGACPILAAPQVVLFGGFRGDVVVNVPNAPGLMGGRFYMQRVDLSLKEVTGTQCSTTYRPTGIRGTSNGVEGIVGR